MTRYWNWNSILTGTAILFLQFWISAKLPGLPMELVNVGILALGVVWILEGLGVEWVNPSIEFYAISYRILAVQFCAFLALQFWFAVFNH